MIPVTSATHFQSRTHRSSRLVKAGFWSSRLIGFVLLALLALLYVAQSSQGQTKSMKLQDLKQTEAETENIKKELTIEEARYKALTHTQAQINAIPSEAPEALVPVNDPMEFLGSHVAPTSATSPITP